MARHDQIGTPGGSTGSGRSGGRAFRPGAAVVYVDSTNEEETKVSPLMKRVSFPLVLALSCSLAACSMGPRKTDAELRADKETAQRVETALNADKALYAKHISVQADNGVVRLTGYVWDASDFEIAVVIAEGVEGVTGVVNNLELNRNGNDAGPVSR